MGSLSKILSSFLIMSLFYGPPRAQADGDFTNQYNAVGAPFNVSAVPVSLDQTTNRINTAMQNCANSGTINSALPGVAGVATKLEPLILGGNDKDSAGGAAVTKSCSAKCDKVSAPADPVCTTFTKKDGEHKRARSTNSIEKAQKIGGDFATYVDCLQNKIDSNCESADAAAANAQLKVLQCQMDALQQGTAQAAQALQGTMGQNTTQAGKMVQAEGEKQDQIGQMNRMLTGNPDSTEPKEGETGGLMGLQKTLLADMTAGGKINADEDKLKTGKMAIEQSYKDNDENLESSRMNMVGNCMTSTPVGQCWKSPSSAPASGSDPIPGGVQVGGGGDSAPAILTACSPMDYIRSQIKASQLVNANGQIQSGEDDRRNNANSMASSFDTLRGSLEAAFGGVQKADPSKPPMDNIGTSTQDWPSIRASIAGQANFVDPYTHKPITIVINGQAMSVLGALDFFSGSCFQRGDTYRTLQKTRAGSAYMKKKTEIDAQQSKMISDSKDSIAKMKDYFKNATSLLAGVATNWSNYNCPVNDPKSALLCYQDMKQKVQDLKEGGKNTFTTKAITGGMYVQGGTIACTGIDTCVSKLINARTSATTSLGYSRKARINFSNQANAQVTQQLQSFAMNLQGLQAGVNAQYAAVAATIRKMGGTDVPPAMATIAGESLKPAMIPPPEGKDPGPFGPPESADGMGAVLSKMMSPGLTDFKNSGLDKAVDGLTAAKTAKNDKTKELIDAATASAKAYKDIEGTCDMDSSDSATASVMGMGFHCENLLDSCQALNSATKDGGSATDVTGDLFNTDTNLGPAIEALFSLNDDKNKENRTDADKQFKIIQDEIKNLRKDRTDPNVVKCKDVINACLADANRKKNSYSEKEPAPEGNTGETGTVVEKK